MDEGPAPAPPPVAEADRRALRIDLEFDGQEFLGWQRQRVGRTVQATLEACLEQVLGAPHSVIASGRTDAGAHARHLVTGTRTASILPARRIHRALDATLPQDVGVLSVREAPADFHAQRDAAWKWYRYRLLQSVTRRPLRRGNTWRRPSLPALERLQRAAGALRGRHDFCAFANVGSTATQTVRTLYHLRVTPSGDEVHVDAVGDGFLYKMVRNLVGSLLAAAGTQDPVGVVQGMLGARDRRFAGRAAPAHGLTLMAVAMRGETPPDWVPLDLHPEVDLNPQGDGSRVACARPISSHAKATDPACSPTAFVPNTSPLTTEGES